jgi:endogenous inhibitor of DNA gyrase (YacG/DUF329 family)
MFLLMEHMSTLVCPVCSTSFSRATKAHRRNLKLGRPTTCSRRCQAVNVNVAKNGTTVGFGFYTNLCRKRASKKGIPCDLTNVYMYELFHAQKGVCAISGLPMTLNTNSKKLADKSPFYASVDRIDNDLGYVQGNVQFVCLGINYMRNTFSVGATLEFLSRLRA